MVLAGQVAGEHWHPGGCLVPAPFVDADEEHPQGAEPMREGGGGEPGFVLPGTFRQPRLVVLDVVAGQLLGGGHLRCGLDQERSEERRARSAPVTLPGLSTQATWSR